jgi:hypothetical protein
VTIKDDPAHSIAGLGNLVGLPFGIVDDDERYLDPGVNDLPRTDLVTDAVRAKFVPAYIEVDTVVANATVSVPFILNVPADIDTNLNKNVPTSNAYWACRIIAAFQPNIGVDLDPIGEATVVGGSKGGDSYIYLEILRDEQQTGLNHPVGAGYISEENPGLSLTQLQEFYQAALDAIISSRQGVVAHEIGHNPENALGEGELPDHREKGLMREGASSIADDEFTALTISRFRKSKKWAD